jgi:hypothetical protein
MNAERRSEPLHQSNDTPNFRHPAKILFDAAAQDALTGDARRRETVQNAASDLRAFLVDGVDGLGTALAASGESSESMERVGYLANLLAEMIRDTTKLIDVLDAAKDEAERKDTR